MPGTVTEEGLGGLETLKTKLVPPPVLTISKNKRQYTLHTDASDRQSGCVLLQKQDDGTT